MQKYIIIVAGGKGTRMGTDIPKQFLLLCGKPVLMHTIEAFYQYDENIGIVLVLPEEQQLYWQELCEQYKFIIKHTVVSGGKTRFHSVKNGLNLVAKKDAIVGIHDGVRPLVPLSVISECYKEAEQKGTVFPVIPVVDTLRQKTASGSVLVDRENYCLVQTPQVFDASIIQDAYNQEYSEKFTDDISVVEIMGKSVFSVEGSRRNIKITTPEDLIVAEAFMGYE